MDLLLVIVLPWNDSLPLFGMLPRRPSGIPAADYNTAAVAEGRKLVADFEKQYLEVQLTQHAHCSVHTSFEEGCWNEDHLHHLIRHVYVTFTYVRYT